MKLRIGHALGLGAALVATPAFAHHYYLTAHNHTSEAVFFSCNGSHPREIHPDAERQVVIEGAAYVRVACQATHDGQVVWHQHVDMNHDSPYMRFSIAPSHHDDGD